MEEKKKLYAVLSSTNFEEGNNAMIVSVHYNAEDAIASLRETAQDGYKNIYGEDTDFEDYLTQEEGKPETLRFFADFGELILEYYIQEIANTLKG